MRRFSSSSVGRLGEAVRGTLHNYGVLSRQLGQFRTMTSQRSVDADGDPIPWFTYPATAYLSQFDYSDKRVFEFGSGSSTRYWATRAKEVVAVEHDPAWHSQMRAQLPSNAHVVLAENEQDFTTTIARDGRSFDVVVIDGWWRDTCVAPALAALAPGGLLVLDNSDWLPRTSHALRSADLIQVDFTGFGPICRWQWTTSVFLSRSFAFVPLGDIPARPIGGSDPPESAAGR